MSLSNLSCGTTKAYVKMNRSVQLLLFVTSAMHKDGCLASGPGQFALRGKCQWCLLRSMLGGGWSRSGPLREKKKTLQLATLDSN
jgi:hypothetical protein